MKLYSKNNNYMLYSGNMLDMLEEIPAESIGAVITDPPYELNFMSKGWDNAGISFQSSTWRKCYEVLKPGGYLLAFGGSRTFHRIACAIEDAGFEIRDTIMWLYGSGFPKSMNIGLAVDKKNGIDNRTGEMVKGVGSANTYSQGEFDTQYEQRIAQNEWKGWGTALKPAFEPIIVARKPFSGSLVDNIEEYGVGGMNIDECRVPLDGEAIAKNVSFTEDKQSEGWGTRKCVTELDDSEGRFPANVVLTYGEADFDEVCGGFPDTKGNGNIRHNNNAITQAKRTQDGAEIIFNYGNCESRGYEDFGSACRYFYCAKASKKDRDEGLAGFEKKLTTDGCIRSNSETARKFGANSALRKNIHPTVKPTELMQYLIRLVTPKGETILDPFNGSGSTGKAVMYENIEREMNYKYIGIELTEEYLPIAKARIEAVNGEKCDELFEIYKERGQITFEELIS